MVKSKAHQESLVNNFYQLLSSNGVSKLSGRRATSFLKYYVEGQKNKQLMFISNLNKFTQLNIVEIELMNEGTVLTNLGHHNSWYSFLWWCEEVGNCLIVMALL